MLLECKDCQKEKNEAGENGRNKTEEYKKEDENMSDELKKNKDDIQIMEAQEPDLIILAQEKVELLRLKLNHISSAWSGLRIHFILMRIRILDPPMQEEEILNYFIFQIISFSNSSEFDLWAKCFFFEFLVDILPQIFLQIRIQET